jgi:branched-subunit amino acid ABC-type transport system permease component
MPWAQSNTQPQKPGGWIARHPKIFGALVGFGAGCALGASQVGGSEDNFFNALDEFACPTVGGIGAVAGAVVGSLFK